MSDSALCGSTCLACGQSCAGEICSKCLEEVGPAWMTYALERGMCICPELEDLADGPDDYADEHPHFAGKPSRPACPVHGDVLYGGEPILFDPGFEGEEPECQF